jgi:hypothetical protein
LRLFLSDTSRIKYKYDANIKHQTSKIKNQTLTTLFAISVMILSSSFISNVKKKSIAEPSPTSKNSICNTIDIENIIDCEVRAEVVYIDPSTGNLDSSQLLNGGIVLSPTCPPSCSPRASVAIITSRVFTISAGSAISPVVAQISDGGSVSSNFETALRIISVGGVSVTPTAYCYSNNSLVMVNGTGSCSSTAGFKVEWLGGCSFKFSEQ